MMDDGPMNFAATSSWVNWIGGFGWRQAKMFGLSTEGTAAGLVRDNTYSYPPIEKGPVAY